MRIWLALVVVASVVCIHDAGRLPRKAPKEVLLKLALGKDLGNPEINRYSGEINRKKLVTTIPLRPGVAQKSALVELIVGSKNDIPKVELLSNSLKITFKHIPIQNTRYRIIVKGKDLSLDLKQRRSAGADDKCSEPEPESCSHEDFSSSSSSSDEEPCDKPDYSEQESSDESDCPEQVPGDEPDYPEDEPCLEPEPCPDPPPRPCPCPYPSPCPPSCPLPNLCTGPYPCPQPDPCSDSEDNDDEQVFLDLRNKHN